MRSVFNTRFLSTSVDFSTRYSFWKTGEPGMRGIGMLGANLSLPEHVQTDASHSLKAAKAERLPSGWMSWEALAGGVMLLATRKSGIERRPEDVAMSAKDSLDRVSAAAGKIRKQTNVEAPPVRDRAVDQVVAALGKTVSAETAIELVRLGERLLGLADSECIWPGTHRTAMAGAAVYAADRLTDGRSITQADVIEAASVIVPTSQYQVKDYSREIYNTAEARLQPGDAVPGLVQAD